MGRSINEKREKTKVTTVYLDKRSLEEDPEEERQSKSTAYYIGIVTLLVAYPLVFMLLWNLVIPSVFSLPTIGYFKSLGLLAMSFMLFRK